MKQKSVFLYFFGCVLILGFIVNQNISQAAASDPIVTIQDLYLPPQYSNPRTEKVSHVMIHFISNAIMKPQDPYNVNDVYRIFLNNGVSANYMIGRNGDIYRLVGEDRVAFHAGKGSLPGFPALLNKMNEYSIGIEMLAIGTRNEMLPVMSGKMYDLIAPSNIGYTDAQYRSLNRLLDGILKRHPSVQRDRQHIVGHDEYAPGRKTDPGKLFDWSRIDMNQPSTENQFHTVKEGESLWLIAQKYGTTIYSIANWNHIDPNRDLWVGQKLRIPNYTVQSGDTLWKIAKKYGVSIETIAKFNKIDSTATLLVGQKLRIPTVDQGVTYTVQSGDSLWKIAQKYSISIETIAKFNNLDPYGYFKVGQKLIILQ